MANVISNNFDNSFDELAYQFDQDDQELRIRKLWQDLASRAHNINYVQGYQQAIASQMQNQLAQQGYYGTSAAYQGLQGISQVFGQSGMISNKINQK